MLWLRASTTCRKVNPPVSYVLSLKWRDEALQSVKLFERFGAASNYLCMQLVSGLCLRSRNSNAAVATFTQIVLWYELNRGLECKKKKKSLMLYRVIFKRNKVCMCLILKDLSVIEDPQASESRREYLLGSCFCVVGFFKIQDSLLSFFSKVLV